MLLWLLLWGKTGLCSEYLQNRGPGPAAAALAATASASASAAVGHE